MPEVFIEFWKLRRHGVVDEAVRGVARQRRADRWTLSDALKDRLRPLLHEHGFRLDGPIDVDEPAGRDGFRFTQA
jgi:hypothetical protein